MPDYLKNPLKLGLMLALMGLLTFELAAQSTSPLQIGDPPVAALISISSPDEDGFVTINGAAGAVFPAATVAVRNLYTEDVVYVPAGITGSFSARIYGPGNTPFWVSPAESIPLAIRDRPGSLPGGPGTIITSALPSARTLETPITAISIDGDLADWDAYPTADLGGGIFGLRNQDSIYLAVPEDVPGGAQLVIELTVNAARYEISMNPALPQQAALRRQLEPTATDPAAINVPITAGDDVIELRIALADLIAEPETVALTRVAIESGDAVISEDTSPRELPFIEEQDGIVYPGGPMEGDLTRFYTGGVVAEGVSFWSARGRASTLNPSPGEMMTLEMDVTINAPGLGASQAGLALIGEIGLQPVSVVAAPDAENAAHPIAALHTNNGWSNLLTASGLPLDNVRGDIDALATVTIPPAQVIRRNGALLAGFRFELTIPPDLPRGVYVPVFRGLTVVGDGERIPWGENGVLGRGAGSSRDPLTRLPLSLNVGDVNEAHLPWALLFDHPSDGVRGILPAEDEGRAALSNRVRFNSPSYILPPGDYPLEPYLLNQMPNAYDMTAPPLLPLLFPGGRIQATISRPDGGVDQLPGAPIVQNRLSTAAANERTRFGAQSPVDVYRLTTLNRAYTAYNFDAYGEYTIQLTGTLEDIFGNRYTGGGTYTVVIAEPLDLTPGVLPGTPFHVDDAAFIGGHVAPGLPVDASVRLAFYPLDGSAPVENAYEMRANADGYFTLDPDAEMRRFDAPGEYILDYEARYIDAGGRLWAASQRGAGVVANPEPRLLARGQRGVQGYDAFSRRTEDYRPAWFTAARYPPAGALDVAPEVRPYYPYHPGDVAFLPDNVTRGGLAPALTVHDTQGRYRDWLLGTVDDHVSGTGIPVDWLATIQELPLRPILGGPRDSYRPALLPDRVVNQAYAYISATRPDVTARQFVTGGDHPALLRHWDPDDPYNQQIGAGIDGDRPGDYLFLFGGAVVDNPEAGVRDVSAYAALAVVTDPNSRAGVFPPYRGAAGGPVSPPLLNVRGQPVDIFFHPTGARPGDVFASGDRLAIAGQVAPTLRSRVAVSISTPDGETIAFGGFTSPTGYFYDPAADITLDAPGVWTVTISATPAGTTSAGEPVEPLPVGGVLGTLNRTFEIFVLPAETEPLAWSGGGDVDTSFRPAAPFNFSVPLPEGWTDARAYHSIRTASYVLESGPLGIFGSTIGYQFSPATLANTFPNIEFEARGSGPSASDVILVTFVVTGTDAEGAFVMRARTFTIFHDRLMSFETFDHTSD